MMKTRQWILIGSVLALSSLSLPFIISETSPKPEIQKTPNLELIDGLVELGCTEPAINHAFRHSNLLDDSFDGTYLINAIGYPDDLSKVEFDKCVKIILEKRLPSSHDYSFSRVNMTNACTDEPSVCYGTFANNTSIQVKCDFPIHGCSPVYYGISSTFSVMKDDVSFDVDYSIKGGTVKEMVFSNTANSLWVAIDSVMQGNLTLTIPRDLLDAKMDYCPPRMENSPDDKFFVLLDGEEIWYDEVKTTPEYRTLQILFLNNSTKIEVLGTCFI